MIRRLVIAVLFALAMVAPAPTRALLKSQQPIRFAKSKSPPPPPAPPPPPPTPQFETQVVYGAAAKGGVGGGGQAAASSPGAGGPVGDGSSPLTAEALGMALGGKKKLGGV